MIAIHHHPGSFSERWIEYLSEKKIPYRIVNGYDSDIIAKLKNCTAFLWHLSHFNTQDFLYGKSILFAAEKMGLKVFPNMLTGYHYDDKIAQKYLLESINAPLVPTWVFYERDEALKWIEFATFPKVFKLRRGAGSSNVRLVRSKDEAIRLVKKMFSQGINPGSKLTDVVIAQKRKINSLPALFTRARKIPLYLRKRALTPNERGYIYFQEFIPDNPFDNRVTIIGNRAFSFNRMNRPNDFRASGSGRLVYPKPEDIDKEAIKIAFDISRKLGFQSMAYDFLTDLNTGKKLFTEITYVYSAKAIYDCEGYFDSNFNWYEGHIWPQDAILEDILSSLYDSESRVRNNVAQR